MRPRLPTEFDDALRGDATDELFDALGGNDAVSARGGADTLLGGAGNDVLAGGGGGDLLLGGAGIDTIATGGGRDVVGFDGSALLQAPDQLLDWDVARDAFRLDAAAFGVDATLRFQNALAAELEDDGSNVIVLRDADDDGNAATVFNARSAARLIGNEVATEGEGFFVYFNSALGVNRLVHSADLANGEAVLTVLGAVLTTTGAEAIGELASYGADNFALI